MANEAIPFWDEGESVTGYCSSAVTGKRFVAISGARTAGLPTIAPCTALTSTKAAGVAVRDAAITGKVTFVTEGVWPVTAGEALVAGDVIGSDDTGKAVKLATAVGLNAAAVALGTCWDDTANGADAPIKLRAL